jgi:hypothetical protein
VNGLDPGHDGSTGRHPVDWDLLADHLAGVLAGTPDDARVAALLATDPAWARGAADLSAAMEAVTAQLAAVTRVTMPADISARLEAALAGAPAPAQPAQPDLRDLPDLPGVRRRDPAGSDAATGPGRTRPGGSGPGGTGAGGTGAGGTGPDGSRPGDGRPNRGGPGAARPGGAGRRRLARWAAPLAVAAGVVAFSAFGLNTLIGGGLTGADTDGGAGDSGVYRATQEGGDAAPGEGVPAPADGTFEAPLTDLDAPVLTATGLDHDRTTLPRTEIALESEVAPQASRPAGEEPPATAGHTLNPALVPPALTGFLGGPAPLDRCLAAVAQEAGVAQESIYLVDLARFDGEPAVVMWLRDPAGTTGVWVSGPGCGTPAGNSDARFVDLSG